MKSLNENNIYHSYDYDIDKLEEMLKYLTIWQTRFDDVKHKEGK
ncbi:protein of unknown function [Ruminococcaceae bacterium BL-6]|nr:protein of unknown function [Ruminococcaceae bacterium BL-6]